MERYERQCKPFLKKKWHRRKRRKQGTKIALCLNPPPTYWAQEKWVCAPPIPQQLISESGRFEKIRHPSTGHGTAVASADTSTTIFEVGRRRMPPVVSTSTTRTWLSGPG
ncbi:hypothetical protein EVAR_55854_1 [Eumeta japonica]|uniref:Uncharacterized protein n=1 Tax=Eumeta variegata TaxID=151549 RepID=A0A4C1ZCR8_EUMVA|nr:hypothetical protein EVAR_55854_1 [Eumeta japonica]